MKGYFHKCKGGFFAPDDQDTIELMQGIKTGDVLLFEYRKQRNYKFLKKFRALVQLVFDNQDKYQNKEDLVVELKLQVGHYEEHITLGGKVTYQPKSISFASMDELEFGQFYNKVVDVVLKHFLKDMEKDDLDYMIDQVIGFL